MFSSQNSNDFLGFSGLDFCQPLTLDSVKNVSLISLNTVPTLFLSAAIAQLEPALLPTLPEGAGGQIAGGHRGNLSLHPRQSEGEN